MSSSASVAPHTPQCPCFDHNPSDRRRVSSLLPLGCCLLLRGQVPVFDTVFLSPDLTETFVRKEGCSSFVVVSYRVLLQVPVFDEVFLYTDLRFCHLISRRVCRWTSGVHFVQSLKTCYCETVFFMLYILLDWITLSLSHKTQPYRDNVIRN